MQIICRSLKHIGIHKFNVTSSREATNVCNIAKTQRHSLISKICNLLFHPKSKQVIIFFRNKKIIIPKINISYRISMSINDGLGNKRSFQQK